MDNSMGNVQRTKCYTFFFQEIPKPIKRRQISIFPTLSAGPLARSTVYDKSNFLPASTKLFTDLNILKANGSVSNLIRGIPSLFQRGTKSGNVENSGCTKKQSTRELIFKVQFCLLYITIVLKILITGGIHIVVPTPLASILNSEEHLILRLIL